MTDKHYTYTVVVSADTQGEADTVMGERLGHDEDYGFDYTVAYSPNGERPADLLPPALKPAHT